MESPPRVRDERRTCRHPRHRLGPPDRRAAGERGGHFLPPGSASLDLMQQASETLAGRVAYAELAPVNLLELPGKSPDVQRLWTRGGFPDSVLAADDAESLAWRDAFVRSYLERDVPMFAPRLPAETWDDVLGHPVAGPSWEGFVIENILAVAGSRRTPYYYRTEDGAEVDLLLERGGSIQMAIEIRRSTAPEVSKGFRSAREVLKPRKSYLVHSGEDAWPVDNGVEAISLGELM